MLQKRLQLAATLLLPLAFLSNLGMAAESDSVITVSAEPLSNLVRIQSRSYPATVVSRNTAKISPKLNAEIVSMPFLVGDQVLKGQSLARLECDLFALETDAAKAGLDQAREELARIKALRKTNVASAQQFTSVSVASRQAAVAYKRAQLQVTYCDVAAPFDGVITHRIASLGDFAIAGAPIIGLVETGNTEVKVLLPVDVAASLPDVGNLFFKQTTSQHPLKLRTIVPVIDQITKTQEARLTTSNALIPGGFGRLAWDTKTKFLPPDMLQQRDGKFGIFIVKDDRGIFHLLPDAVVGKATQINLPDSTQVITLGRHSLEDDQRIKLR